MKKHTLLLLLSAFFALNGLQAQDTIRTLFHPAKVRSFGLYVAPEFQYGQMDNTFTTFSGASAMLLFNRRLAVGMTGMRSLEEGFSPASVSPLILRSYFGGGKIEYTLRSHKAVHLTFPLVVGMGMARADSLNSRWDGHPHELDFDDDHRGRNHRGRNYFVVQPGVRLEANLLRNVQLFTGVNYRISANTGTTTTTLPDNLMQGISFSAGIKAGFFAIRSPRSHRHHATMPPDEVLRGFMEKFPAAPAPVKWHRERNGEWEAEFEVNNAETSANFTANGQWLETETEITFADLPAVLQTAMKDVKAKEYARIQTADGKTMYEVEVKGKDLLFDEHGILIFN